MSAVSAVSAAMAVLAAKEMVREASRRGKKFIIPLFPRRPSEAQPHMVVLLPFWLAGIGEAVGDSGAGGADGGSAAGLIGRDLLAVFLAAFCSVLALMAMVATGSWWQRRRYLAMGALLVEGACEREQVRDTMCCPAA